LAAKDQARKSQGNVGDDLAVALVADFPDDPDAPANVAAACNGLAVVYSFTNRTESAIELYRESATHYGAIG